VAAARARILDSSHLLTRGARLRLRTPATIALSVASILGVARAAQVPGEDAVAATSQQAALASPATAKPTKREVAWDIPNLEHARVGYWISRFQTDKRDEFERFLTRKGRYEHLITEALDEREMPRDLVYLAMIESGFNPKAYSRSRASGLWQFISETGRRYGLDVNNAVDERNDPVKATKAALQYLSQLYWRFGSWYLAAAAYNTGENRVGRVMRQTKGREKGTDADYYAIWPYLPYETRDYVPLMIAAARISKDPDRYGFGHVLPLEPMSFDEVVVSPGTRLAALAKENGTTVADLKDLNPQIKLDRTRGDEPATIRVPSKGDAARGVAEN
jgi:membrane-bound lytic murein transglycosylase D